MNLCGLVLTAALLAASTDAMGPGEGGWRPELGGERPQTSSDVTGPTPTDFVDEGIRLYRAGDLDGASRALTHATALDARSVTAFYHLAKIHLIQGDPYGAFYAIKEVLALEPTFAKGPLLLMEIIPPLLRRVASDIKSHRDLGPAYNILGWLLIYRGRFEEGIAREEYALKAEPRLAEAHDDEAWAHYLQRDLAHAYDEAAKAFEINPVKGSIAGHYQQLFNIRRLGLATPEASFYPPPPPLETASAATPETPPPEVTADTSILASEDVLVRDYLAALRTMGPQRPAGGAVAEGIASDAGDAGISGAPGGVAAGAAGGRAAGASTAGTVPASPPSPAVGAGDPAAAAAAVDQKVRSKLRRDYEKARALREQGLLREALKIYQDLYGVDPGYSDVAIQMHELKEMLDAREAYEDAVRKLHAGDAAGALALLQGIDVVVLGRVKGIRSVDNLIGEAAMGTRDFRLASDALGRWVKANPKDADARWLLVQSLMSEHEAHEAYAEICALGEASPEFVAEHHDVRPMQLKLWVRTHLPLVIGLALLWIGAAGGYTGFRVNRGAQQRKLKRLMAKVQAALRKERWADVVRACDEVAPLRKGPAETVYVTCARATALLGLGDTARAEKVYDEVGTTYPSEPSVQHLRSRLALVKRDSSPEAIEGYEKLLSIEPNNRALLEILNAHYQATAPDSEMAVRVLERLLDLKPTDGALRYYRALRYLRAGDHGAAAREAYLRCLESDPHRADVRAAVARAHYKAGEFLEAIKEAKTALETDPDDDGIHQILLSSYARVEMLEEARREYVRLSRLHPKSMVLRQWMEKIDTFVPPDALPRESSEKELRALYDKGMKLFADGRPRDAVAPLTAAYGLPALRLAAGSLLVRTYLRLRDTRMAMAVFDGIELPLRPEDFLLEVCYDMAMLNMREGRREKAVELLTYICRTNVSFKDAFKKLEELTQKPKA